MAALGWLLNLDFAGSGGASIAISGTATTGISETDVGGSKTIIGVVTGDTLVATFGDDNAITSAFLAGISSDLSESTGWNAVVRDTLTHANVVRDSDTQFTVTLEASYPTYDITADETITVTVPATSLTAAVGVVGSPAFGISAVVADEVKAGGRARYAKRKYPRQVLIDGVRYWVNWAAEERRLLAAYAAKLEREALILALEEAPKAKIAKARVKVVRASRRIDETAQREAEWLAYLQEEDELIMLTLD